MTEDQGFPQFQLDQFLQRLAGLQALDDVLPDEESPVGKATAEFFANNWRNACDGLLAKTKRIRVRPTSPLPAPRGFRFEIDTRFKQKQGPEPVALVDGPIRGTIRYRADLFLADPDEPSIAVFLDPEQHFFHPNYSRNFGVLCLGGIPSGPYPLDALLEHLYWILTYQNTSSSDPADREAARYFACDPDAMAGLENVEPLY